MNSNQDALVDVALAIDAVILSQAPVTEENWHYYQLMVSKVQITLDQMMQEIAVVKAVEIKRGIRADGQ